MPAEACNINRMQKGVRLSVGIVRPNQFEIVDKEINTMTDAELFLGQKLRETIAECGAPALGAALVRTQGATIVSGQQGIRKVGASGQQNQIQPYDKFNLGSVSKVFTGALMGALIQQGVGGLRWDTRIVDVFPDIQNLPGWRAEYIGVTIEHLMTHTSGMPYQPAHDDANAYLTWPPQELTKPKLMQHRRDYVYAAVIDPPVYALGAGVVYDGGAVICAAMAEQRTGKTYEDLMQEYVYGPLGMTHSGFGVLSTEALNGPWQHRWDAANYLVVPDEDTKKPAASWHPRIPVGGACCSAADMGTFLQEQVRPDPQHIAVAARSGMQTHHIGPAFVRGGWGASLPDYAITSIGHDGDNGVSYASVNVSLSKKTAAAAMSNMNNTFAVPAIYEMHETLRAMDEHWSALFESGDTQFWECAHPMPALAFAGQRLLVFGRQHDGIVLRRLSTDTGSTWQAAIAFPGAIITSGLSASVSADGQHVYVFGRGADNRIWFASSADGGTTWPGWNPIGAGTFLSGPAAVGSGGILHVFAVGMDSKMYRTRSVNGTQLWSNWEPIGQGVFTSAPAAAASQDGKIIHVFGRGRDYRVWRNVSMHSGATWGPHWAPIGQGIFTSGPAAAASSTGAKVHVIGRGTDRKLWHNTSENTGANWQEHWQPIPYGTFTSAPALATASDGSSMHICAFGGDFRIYRNHSSNDGQAWDGWQQIGPEYFL
jgi:CubicO group peptidase (beta-lactamase class C family)